MPKAGDTHDTIKCGADGNWDENLPKCVKKSISPGTCAAFNEAQKHGGVYWRAVKTEKANCAGSAEGSYCEVELACNPNPEREPFVPGVDLHPFVQCTCHDGKCSWDTSKTFPDRQGKNKGAGLDVFGTQAKNTVCQYGHSSCGKTKDTPEGHFPDRVKIDGGDYESYRGWKPKYTETKPATHTQPKECEFFPNIPDNIACFLYCHPKTGGDTWMKVRCDKPSKKWMVTQYSKIGPVGWADLSKTDLDKIWPQCQ